MTAAEIVAEHARAQTLRAADLKGFLDNGVPAPALSWTAAGQLSMLKRTRTVFDRLRFDFTCDLRDATGATAAFIIPLLDALGEPVDLLAFRPGGPAATWLGRASIAGAEQVLAPRPDLGDELMVHETVLDWLRAARNGIVILHAQRAAGELEGVTLRAASADHARRLRAALTRPAPRIVVAAGPARLTAGRAA